MSSRSPLRVATGANSSVSCASSSPSGIGEISTAVPPASRREMSRSAPRMPSTLASALRAFSSAPRFRAVPASSRATATKSLAADSGCNRSWLAAATKRTRAELARSASASAAARSSVRAATRASSVALARSMASIAIRSRVTSVKDITNPAPASPVRRHRGPCRMAAGARRTAARAAMRRPSRRASRARRPR